MKKTRQPEPPQGDEERSLMLRQAQRLVIAVGLSLPDEDPAHIALHCANEDILRVIDDLGDRIASAYFEAHHGKRDRP
ncbi:MAG: hypothetical protein KGJ86_06885 [Chloroflexota bacterium]|nr:hypothetical protein [Chloroflexota bacterium]